MGSVRWRGRDGGYAHTFERAERQVSINTAAAIRRANSEGSRNGTGVLAGMDAIVRRFYLRTGIVTALIPPIIEA